MEKKGERKQERALRKKAYEKPRVVHQQSLEVAAGVPCTGANDKEDELDCSAGQIQS